MFVVFQNFTIFTKSACGHGHFTKSPVAEHVWKKCSYIIQWNHVLLLDCSHHMIERKVKEAIYINMASRSLVMNRDTRMELSLLILRTARGQRL